MIERFLELNELQDDSLFLGGHARREKARS